MEPALEIRWADDAWYDAELFATDDLNVFRIRWINCDQTYDELWTSKRFFKAGLELSDTIRIGSVQLQDYDCNRLGLGHTVCAALKGHYDTLKYYDATVIEVSANFLSAY
ncbi:hypothetical protein O6H91_09G035700 [Diphasiastrum complanatum]|uniref:Uncharacterized protein n=1 Tax=Diphasiastrum complanatum TaxID=34168 RepID=A0ACC2CMZ9_DIPCM|nr:hypothetical protein O6H91_09G035700 [Diphasiastrum complanatum]